MNGFIGQFHMQGMGIGIGINRAACNIHGAGGADHPAGDFPAIGDQDFF